MRVVYIGLRLVGSSGNSRLAFTFRGLDEAERFVGSSLAYQKRRGVKFIRGGIYELSIDENKAANLHTAEFQRMISGPENSQLYLRWELEERQAELAYKRATTLNTLQAESTIRETLKPLRELYQSATSEQQRVLKLLILEELECYKARKG